jgi:hypothetical protein
LSVYGKFATEKTGKPIGDLTVEDLISGLVSGRHKEGDMVDRVLCYRSAHNVEDIQFSYVRGIDASIAVLGSANTKEARVVWKDGAIANAKENPNYGVPQYLRDLFTSTLREVSTG